MKTQDPCQSLFVVCRRSGRRRLDHKSSEDARSVGPCTEDSVKGLEKYGRERAVNGGSSETSAKVRLELTWACLGLLGVAALRHSLHCFMRDFVGRGGIWRRMASLPHSKPPILPLQSHTNDWGPVQACFCRIGTARKPTEAARRLEDLMTLADSPS